MVSVHRRRRRRRDGPAAAQLVAPYSHAESEWLDRLFSQRSIVLASGSKQAISSAAAATVDVDASNKEHL